MGDQMSKRKNVIHANDRVKIINPLIFVRCGYPLTIDIVKDTIITQEQKDAVIVMLKSFGINYVPTDLNKTCELLDLSGWNDSGDAYDKILYEMSRIVLRQQRWGGVERKVYTEFRPDLINVTCQVVNKRVVKTGVHESGGGYTYDYWGEADYQSPYLSNEKSHIILEIYTDGCNGMLPVGKKIEIEQCNVIKI